MTEKREKKIGKEKNKTDIQLGLKEKKKLEKIDKRFKRPEKIFHQIVCRNSK